MTTQAIMIDAAKRALVRAYAEGVHRRFEMIDGTDECAEGLYRTDLGGLYWVTLAGCSCPAGRAKMICKHTVSLADLTGLLELLIPGVYSSPLAQGWAPWAA